MPPLDVRQIGDQMIASAKGHTERVVNPLREKVQSLETTIAALPTADFVRAEVLAAANRTQLDLLGALAKSTDGKTITVEDVRPMVETLIKSLPVPKDGVDGKDGAPGADGKNVDPAEVERMVGAAVAAKRAESDLDLAAFGDAVAKRFMRAALE